ncbi:hypothetical protein ACRXDB_06325 [Bordetella pertussis]|uniref:hypothetical protein n=1 Tax=Bordetella pertussis TaxID=520 RepID=UPI00040DD1F9
MNWGGGDFQFLKSGSDEPCIQPIESSQLDTCYARLVARFAGYWPRRGRGYKH